MGVHPVLPNPHLLMQPITQLILHGFSLLPGEPILFINKSTPAPSANPLWSFGDGAAVSGITYGHSYAAAGNYNS